LRRTEHAVPADPRRRRDVVASGSRDHRLCERARPGAADRGDRVLAEASAGVGGLTAPRRGWVVSSASRWGRQVGAEPGPGWDWLGRTGPGRAVRRGIARDDPDVVASNYALRSL